MVCTELVYQGGCPLVSHTKSSSLHTKLRGVGPEGHQGLHQNVNKTSSASIHQDYKDTTTQYSICKASLPQQHFLETGSKPLQKLT